ncbi:T6SS effector BTH_I2691 family protein [Citrobacter amalonaticus]|uniref:T6SS effector BTH_I2691 family protein n=1 Tax=Citrobacter amalonaticus TaxID=35703 RepID=UPI00300CF818
MRTGKGCKFCIRHGLPILPVRPSVMAKETPLPSLPASIIVPVKAEGETDYTSRVLRQGFLYIWAERGQRWINYYVTTEGYFYPLPEDGSVPPMVASGEIKPCISSPEELATASLITLPVKPAGLINGVYWFSWSEEQWTDSVRKQHEQAEWQAKYMQKFDMDAWIIAHQGQQILPFDRLTSTVAEYSPTLDNSQLKAWSPFPPKEITRQGAADLQQAAQELNAQHAAILVLDDPVGVVMEISALTRYRLGEAFTSNPEYRRGMALTMMINSLELGLRKQFQSSIESYDEILDSQTRYGWSMAAGDMPMFPQPERADELKAQAEKHLQKRVDNSWADYEKYIDREKMQVFNEKLKKDMTLYNQNSIVPVTQMYLNWLQSQTMTSYFVHHFDTTSAHSGARYMTTVFNCLAGMTDKGGVINYIDSQLSQVALRKENYLLRAVFFNNDEWASLVDAQIKAVSGPDWFMGISWDRLADMMKDFSGKYSVYIQQQLEQLSFLFQYSLIKSTGHMVKGMPVRLTVALLVSQGKALRIITTDTSLKAYIRGLTQGMAGMLEMSAKSGGTLYNTLRKQMEKQLKGIPESARANVRLPVAIDVEELNRISLLPEAEKLKQLSNAALTEEDVFRMAFPASQRSAVAQAEGMSAGSLAEVLEGGKLPFAGSFISALFQGWVLLHSERPKGWEDWGRFGSSAAMAVAAVMDTLKRALTPLTLLELPPVPSNIVSRVLKFVSLKRWEALGYAGGMVYAALEVGDGYADIKVHKTDIGIAHLVNGVGVGLVTVASGSEITIGILTAVGVAEASMAEGTVLAMMLGPAGILFGVALILAAGVYLLLHTRDDFQAWLARTQWRRIPKGESDIPEIYPEKQELEAFNKLCAAGGEDA